MKQETKDLAKSHPINCGCFACVHDRLEKRKKAGSWDASPTDPISQEELMDIYAEHQARGALNRGEKEGLLEARGKTHGNFMRQSEMSQDLKRAAHGGPIAWDTLSTSQREAIDMILLKVSRILCGNPNEADHWDDIAGYATLVSNILKKGTPI